MLLDIVGVFSFSSLDDMDIPRQAYPHCWGWGDSLLPVWDHDRQMVLLTIFLCLSLGAQV